MKGLSQQGFISEHHAFYVIADHHVDVFFSQQLSRHVIPPALSPSHRRIRLFDHPSHPESLAPRA
jgi:hypothetical protein